MLEKEAATAVSAKNTIWPDCVESLQITTATGESGEEDADPWSRARAEIF